MAVLTVAPKDVEQTVTVQPYYVYNNEDVLGDVKTLTVASMLETYAGGGYGEKVANMAAAVLNYAAAAQKYFKVEGGLTYTAQTPSGTYIDKLSIRENIVNPDGGVTVRPKSVSLLLNDVVNIKFVFDVKTTGYYLRAATTREGLAEMSAEYVEIVYDESVDEWVAVIGSVVMKNWNKDIYFQVYDNNGQPVSASFIYGVSTYYARMNNTASKNLTNLVNAMMVLYETTL